MLGVLNQKKKPLADPNLTLALLNFQAANGSTAFTDSSPFNRNFATRFGTPVISTTQSKFGGSSLFLDGASSIRALDAANLELFNSNFTFEFWIHPTASVNNIWLVTRWETGSLAYSINTNGSGKIVFDFRTEVSAYVATGATTIPINAWTHIAVVRNGNSIRLYVNGILDAQVTSMSGSIIDGTSRLIIGTWPTGGYGLVGYFYGFRLRKETMYLTDFTPPNAPLTY